MCTLKSDQTCIKEVDVPFIGGIPNELKPGNEIKIVGHIPYGAVQFAVNLVCDYAEDKLGDIAFHFNVRFNQRCVVRNARVDNHWVCEERDGILPFHTGQKFTILILAERISYKVAVNGTHFCEYVHRIPFVPVKLLNIEGDVQVEELIYCHSLYPAVPYSGIIPNGIHIGQMIEIIGRVESNAHRFEINLICDHEPHNKLPDVALHINPRFDVDCVVRNSFINKQWNAEDRFGALPFHKGKEFRILILTEASEYKIAVNGVHLCEFAHRLPFTSVKFIKIEGDCDLKRIIYHNANQGQHALTQSCGPINPLLNPVVPFTHLVQTGFYQGMMFYISGRPTVNPYRFIINLQCGDAPYPDPDVALHISSRFDQAAVVRNSKIGGSYGREETYIPYFPFQPGVYFDMIIRVEDSRYMIAINGQHFVEYQHRIMPISRINALHVEGDVVITSVRLQ